MITPIPRAFASSTMLSNAAQFDSGYEAGEEASNPAGGEVAVGSATSPANGTGSRT